jgi:HK97 family phage portal protein
MSILGRAVRAFEGKAVDASSLTEERIFGERASKSGASVTVRSSWRVSAVAGCVSAIAKDVSQLPLKLVREEESGKENVVRDRELYRVVSRRPNVWQTSLTFRGQLTAHAALGHGGYALITRDGDGEVMELLPAPYGAVSNEPALDGTPRYFVQLRDGSKRLVPTESLLRIAPLSWDGMTGMSAYNNARESIGLAIAMEESQSKLHLNGGRPSGVLSTDASFKNADTPKKIRDEWRAIYGTASEEGGSVAVLDSGMKYTQLSMTGIDAETLASRKYEVEETCRFFDMPPWRIGYSDKTSTYASAAEAAEGYVRNCLMWWVINWEQSLSFALLTEEEIRSGLCFKHELKGFLRGNHAARSAYLKSALGTASSPGWMSVNDARRAEDMDPSDQEGADEIVTPSKMAGKAAPGAPPAPEDAPEDDPAPVTVPE